MNYSRILSAVWTGIAATMVVAIYQPIAAALSPQEVAQVAKAISVQVNPPPTDPNQNSGTGIILSKQGNRYTVLTCDHVLQDQPATIRTPDRKSYAIIDRRTLSRTSDPSHPTPDLALLTFESTEEYPVAKLGDSEQATLGAAIFVYGFPVDQTNRLAGERREEQFVPGFVTNRLSQDPNGAGYTLRYNAITSGGMSGGPVLDTEGRVIGVHGEGEVDTQTVRTQSGGVPTELAIQTKTGINAAVPIKTYLELQPSTVNPTVDVRPSTDRPADRLQNPDSALAFAARGEIRQSQGNQSGALNDYNQAISMDTTNASVFFRRAELRYRQGDRQGADQDYTQAIALNPNYANAYFNRGVIRNGLGNKAGAVQDFTTALSFDPSDILAYYSRGVVRRSLQDARGTFEDFDAVVRMAPNRFEGYYNRALAWAMLGNREAVVADLTQALAINPKYSPAYINRALTRRRLGDREGAIQDLSYVLSYEPNNATATYNRGLFRRDLGDRQGAFDDLQRAVALFQQAGDTANYQKASYVIQQLQIVPLTPATNPVADPNFPVIDGGGGSI